MIVLVIKVLQGSVVTQTVLDGLTTYPVAFLESRPVRMCQK